MVRERDTKPRAVAEIVVFFVQAGQKHTEGRAGDLLREGDRDAHAMATPGWDRVRETLTERRENFDNMV